MSTCSYKIPSTENLYFLILKPDYIKHFEARAMLLIFPRKFFIVHRVPYLYLKRNTGLKKNSWKINRNFKYCKYCLEQLFRKKLLIIKKTLYSSISKKCMTYHDYKGVGLYPFFVNDSFSI